MSSVLGTLLPPPVATAEAIGAPGPPTLLPEEWAITTTFCARRLREFAAVRTCARQALREIGAPAPAILPGTAGAPQWPPGVVGSLTHCAGFVGSAVAWSRQVRYLGIDAEQDAALPSEVVSLVCTPAEQHQVVALAGGRSALHWDTVIFSAKESVYKAWYPMVGSWLDFHDVRVQLHPEGPQSCGRFVALVYPGKTAWPAQSDRGPDRWFDGSWTVADGVILTVVSPRQTRRDQVSLRDRSPSGVLMRPSDVRIRTGSWATVADLPPSEPLSSQPAGSVRSTRRQETMR